MSTLGYLTPGMSSLGLLDITGNENIPIDTGAWPATEKISIDTLRDLISGNFIVASNYRFIADAFAAATGRTLYIPAGTYVHDSVSEGILWPHAMRIIGDGPGLSAITFTQLASDVDGLTAAPAGSGYDNYGWSIQGVRLYGNNAGRYGFRMNIADTASAFIARFAMRDCYISGFGQRAFSMNKGAEGGTPVHADGFFTSVVENNVFYANPSADYVVYLDNSGDSLTFTNNTFTGGGIGLYSRNVTGAAQQVFNYNNITATGGAIYLKNGAQTLLEGNQIEQNAAYTGSNDAQVVFESCTDCNINCCNLNSQNRVSNLRFKTSTRIGGKNNVMRVTASKFHFVFDSGNFGDNDLSWRENDLLVDEVRVYTPLISAGSTAPNIFRKFVRRSAIGNADYTILVTDETLEPTVAFTTPRTWTLPLAAAVPPGKTIVINDAPLGAITATNTLTLARSGSDLINGAAASWPIKRPRQVTTFYSNGTNGWSLYPLDASYTAFGDADAAFDAQLTRVAATVIVLTAPRVWTLPLAANYPAGTPLVVVDRVAAVSATNYITLTAAGSDTINTPATTFVFNRTNGAVILYSNGITGWSAVSVNPNPNSLQLADNGAGTGPIFALERISASPAANDLMGAIQALGRNSTGSGIDYAALIAQIVDETAGSEDGRWLFYTTIAGAFGPRGYVQDGFVFGTPTGGDKGVGTLNLAIGLYSNGTKVVGNQGALVADASGGATIDAECRTALNLVLARLRAHGLIAT